MAVAVVVAGIAVVKGVAAVKDRAAGTRTRLVEFTHLSFFSYLSIDLSYSYLSICIYLSRMGHRTTTGTRPGSIRRQRRRLVKRGMEGIIDGFMDLLMD